MPPTHFKPYPMRTAQEKRTAYLDRWTRLKAERSSYIDHWNDLARHILPRAARFSTSDQNRSGRSHYNAIYDNTGTRAQTVLSAGMMAGMTSPARPWFRLTTEDPDLRESHAIGVWLDEVTERMLMVFGRSNVYRTLQEVYDDLGVFGVSATLVLSDFETVIRCYPMTVGEYCLQQDYQGRVIAVYREFERTVGEVVKEFGYENCSTQVQQYFDNRNLEAEVKILHVVEPRADQDRNPGSPSAVNMPWRSVYLEISNEADKILRESGFRRMRVLAPRWATRGGDVYPSSCPGMVALGDIRQLQQEQLRKSQAIDYQSGPPVQVPATFKGREDLMLPRGVSYFEPRSILPFDQTTPNGGVRTAFEVPLRIDFLLNDILDVRQRIKQAFYEDLFLMLATRDPNKMTATEVLERQEEKLLMIGPVIERMTNELLEPLINITFQEMLEVGALPPPPPELLGRELSVEFVSILAQAQRAVGITSVQQWINDLLVVAGAGRPDVLDNVDFDEWVRSTGRMRGVDNEMLVDELSVQRLRQARAEAEAAREQTALAREQAGAIKDLSTVPANQDSALNEVLGTLSGYGVPAGAA